MDRVPLSYCSMIPSVPELSSDRILEPLRLREMRKRLESGQASQDVENIAAECMGEIVELCSGTLVALTDAEQSNNTAN